MFSDTLIESAAVATPRRRWTAMVSLLVQAAVVSALAVFPLLYPGSISEFMVTPLAPLTSPIVVHAAEPASQPPSGASTSSSAPTEVTVLRRPEQLTYGRQTADDTGPVIPGIPSSNSLVGPVFADARPYEPPRPSAKPDPVKRQIISHLDPGALVHRVEPVYPRLAIPARIQGRVILRAVIDREGNVTALTLVNGHPMLSQAAIDAVRQWRYRPYVLNGQTVEVETQITVNFSLGS
jgi:protein TonB